MLKKAQTNKKTKYKNVQTKNKGITLIALVITIIVILILAGVSINTLFGDNGLLTKAQEAADANTRAGAYDKVATEVLASYDNDGTLNETTLKSNLKSRGGNVKNGEGFSVEVEMDGYTFIINGKGNILSADEIKIGNAINADKYGNEVRLKSSPETPLEEKWRLFYRDNDYTYVIYDNLISLDDTLENKLKNNAKYDNGEKVGAIGQALNPMIKTQKPEMFTLSDSQPNMKGVAYLTDPNNWKEGYLDKLEGALFAIGSPTIELYAASFNATCLSGETKITFEEDIGTYGYKIKSSSGDNLTDRNNGIHMVGENGYWWLASPEDDKVGLECVGELDHDRISNRKRYSKL